MANDYSSNPIVLDTFTSAIDLVSSLGFAEGTPLKLDWIEWQEPTTTGHTAVVTDENGSALLDETCTLANQSIIKYFHGAWVSNVKIGISGIESGKIVVMLR